MTASMTAVALPAGWRLEPHATLDSTNLEAARRALAGAPHGTVITARHQTAGRGRQGRQWEDSGDALLFSLLLRPAESPSAAAQLSFAAAVAVGEALANAAPGLAVSYKWPNDLLLSGRKACGILLESEADPAGGLAFLVVGIGINLRAAPLETRLPATSLAQEGLKVEPDTLLSDICAAFEGWYRRWSDQGWARGPLQRAQSKPQIGAECVEDR